MSYIEEEFYKFLGEKVKIARQAMGMNQGDLAEKVGLQRTSITNIEAGQQKIPVYTLYEIAETLRIPILALLPPSDLEKLETDTEELLLNQEILADDGSKSSLTESEVKGILKVIKL